MILVPGAQLRAAREGARLTQAEVARRMNVRPSRISNVESGRRNPDLPWIARYLGALGPNAGVYVHVRGFVDGQCVIEHSTEDAP